MRGESKRSREIFVMVTNHCNLACSYCYEPVKNRQVISPEAIKPVISRDISNSRENTGEYYLIFHGGEPFLAFPEMKEIAEWAWQTYPELNIVCMVTTNGTVLTPEIREWLTGYRKRFVPILSIDGGRESHNLNRSGSWDRIDCTFFLENWPLQPVKMTIAPNTVDRIFENYLTLSDEGFIVNPSLAKETDWDEEKHLPLFALELKKLADYFVDHPGKVPCELIGIPMQNFAPEAKIPRNRACGAGDNIVAYDVNGHPYPCHAFIGDPTQNYNKTGADQCFEKLKTNDGLLLSPGCEGCFIFSYCSPCYGLNYATRGDMGAFDRKMCRFNKLRVLAAAEMFSRMVTSPMKYKALQDKSPEQLKPLVSGIRAVLSGLTV
jgi:radical SAM protein with 4Fe4S-binding SPASM domain